MIFTNSFFLKTIEKILSNHHKIGIGFSGGGDSLCLMLLILEYIKENQEKYTSKTFEISLLSMNHNIRKESQIEIEFVRKIAQKYSLPIKIFNFKAKSTGNFHNEAHLERYRALLSFCSHQSISAFLTAHHKDDQIETFLMRLEKGSSISSLCSIQSEKIFHKDFQNVFIFRPLLFVSKNEILKFLNKKNQIYISDRSNFNEKYQRSKIRKNLSEKNDYGFSFFKTSEFEKNFNLLMKKTWNSSSALDFYIEKAFQENVFFEKDLILLNSKIFKDHHRETIIQIFKKIFLYFNKVKPMRILYEDIEKLIENISFCMNKINNQDLSKVFYIFNVKIEFLNFHERDEVFIKISANL